MKRRRALGEFELLLLLTLERLGSAASGLDIGREIKQRTGRSVAPGAVYTSMARLRRRGLVSSHLGEPTPRRGGRRQRYYELLPSGHRAIADATQTLQRLSERLAGGGGAV